MRSIRNKYTNIFQDSSFPSLRIRRRIAKHIRKQRRDNFLHLLIRPPSQLAYLVGFAQNGGDTALFGERRERC